MVAQLAGYTHPLFNFKNSFMKKLLLSAVIVSASVFAFAQEKTTQQPPQVKETDEKAYQAKQAQDWDNLIKTELKLTEVQVTKLAAINKEFSEKKEAILKDAGLTDEARKEKKTALKKDKEAKINEVLTPEQQTRYKQLVDAKMKEAPKKGV